MKVYVVEEICNRIDCCRIIDNICVYYLIEKNQWGLLTEKSPTWTSGHKASLSIGLEYGN